MGGLSGLLKRKKKKKKQRLEGTVKMTEKKPSHTPFWNIRLSFTSIEVAHEARQIKMAKAVPKVRLTS